MSWDDEVREKMAAAAEWDMTGPADAIPNGTLKIDGKFVRVEQDDPRTLEQYQTYDGWYRIVDDSDA